MMPQSAQLHSPRGGHAPGRRRRRGPEKHASDQPPVLRRGPQGQSCIMRRMTIEDREAIRDLLYRYCQYADAADTEG